ncbi:tRNA dihydrouridine(20/20a) synthase DusA [Comamonas endophytica]|uniref:tRNA-dihydrouridine(20/20a) synthase n=2 Tax=Comamonas endophytica TaxID=2949090 RepID=A0ABY6G9N8_9BURK|nr:MULTISPECIES: tRNA dihydrouridine(20/20a) synthase DusA [unclassified Acidovorax]UYG51633.1 tRNA dihydrouridine(20/20a) synthase DusA [Acidovorax sp. 5MLIR]
MNSHETQENQPIALNWRMSVAPMMDWTDRHCRYLHRLLTRHTLLYTEMVTTGALLHGDVPRHLRFNAEEHPLALQLGGSEPADLARAARLGAHWGYDEINLNCGCPSERVQRGAFGACLMNEAPLVADGVKAMRDAVDIAVTVKHRIGIDKDESYDFVRDFIGTVAGAGCEVFIVHARNAWLKGLSPKENREVPPLRYEVVARLKRDFPGLTIAINGGFKDSAAVAGQLAVVDGVMVGREAYHNPWWLAGWDEEFYGAAPSALTREAVEELMVEYMEREAREHGTHWYSIARHMLGLRHGLPGARRWRQAWSDHRLKGLPAREVMALARTAPSVQD